MAKQGPKRSSSKGPLTIPRFSAAFLAAVVVAGGGGFGLMKWLEHRTASTGIAKVKTTSKGEEQPQSVGVAPMPTTESAVSYAISAPAIHLDAEDGIVPGRCGSCSRDRSSKRTVFRGQAGAGRHQVVADAKATGKLVQESPTTLLFSPNKPLAYGTSYTATLSAVEAFGKVVSRSKARR